MAGVINDIEAMEDFRARLIQFNTNLADSFTAIRGHWRELGEVWRDEMYQQFGAALEEVTPGIEHYLSATEGHEAHLNALIEQLHGYLEVGGGGGRRRDHYRGRGANRPDDGTDRRKAGHDQNSR